MYSRPPVDDGLARLQRWVGRGESAQDLLAPQPAQQLAATLDLPPERWPRAELPPLWHVLYFHDSTPTQELSDDGTPRDLPLLPPVDAGQLLWAGADYGFHAPLALGVATRRESRVDEVCTRQGRHGPLVFVTLTHRYQQHGQPRLTERLRMVFLDGPAHAGAPCAAPPAVHEHRWPVQEALLFRFSALTFNTHRLHYDHPYATQVAGHPGLLVHGPLQALMMAECLRAETQARPLRSARFRAHAPLYCGAEPLCIREGAALREGQRMLWTVCGQGGMALQGCFGT